MMTLLVAGAAWAVAGRVSLEVEAPDGSALQGATISFDGVEIGTTDSSGQLELEVDGRQDPTIHFVFEEKGLLWGAGDSGSVTSHPKRESIGEAALAIEIVEQVRKDTAARVGSWGKPKMYGKPSNGRTLCTSAAMLEASDMTDATGHIDDFAGWGAVLVNSSSTSERATRRSPPCVVKPARMSIPLVRAGSS